MPECYLAFISMTIAQSGLATRGGKVRGKVLAIPTSDVGRLGDGLELDS